MVLKLGEMGVDAHPDFFSSGIGIGLCTMLTVLVTGVAMLSLGPASMVVFRYMLSSLFLSFPFPFTLDRPSGFGLCPLVRSHLQWRCG